MTEDGVPTTWTVAARTTWQDVDEHRIDRWLAPLDRAESPDAVFLGAPFSSGNTKPTGSWKAPEAIRGVFAEYTTYSADYGIDLAPLLVRDAGDVLVDARSATASLDRIRDSVATLATAFPSSVPVIVGGDHSITAATVEGYASAWPGRRLGVIYFDAHTDVRADQEGVALAGSPVRHLLERCPAVAGVNIVEVGLHGFMNADAHRRWAEQEGITLVSARQVRQDGILSVVAAAIKRATLGTDGVYVSVDVDVLDLPYAIGAGGRISPGGLAANDLLEAMWVLGRASEVAALDMVEVDPIRDAAGATTRVAASAILTFLGGLAARIGRTTHASQGSRRP